MSAGWTFVLGMDFCFVLGMEFCTSLLTCDRRGSDLCSVLPSSFLPVHTREIFLEMGKDGRPKPFGRLYLQLSEKRRAGDEL